MAEVEAVPGGPARQVRRLVASLPIAGLVSAPPRAAAFAVETWWKGRRPPTDDEERARLTFALVAQVALDEAVLAVMRNPRVRSAPGNYESVAEELRAAGELYQERGWLDDPRTYHRDPEALPDPRVVRTWAAGVTHDRL